MPAEYDVIANDRPQADIAAGGSDVKVPKDESRIGPQPGRPGLGNVGEAEGVHSGGKLSAGNIDAVDPIDPGPVTADMIAAQLVQLPLFAGSGEPGLAADRDAGADAKAEAGGGAVLIRINRQERARARALDHALVLSGWNPCAATESPQEHASRVEAARRAAARDAADFFSHRAEVRAAAQSFDGLAHHEAVQAVRCRPWDRFARTALEKAGLDVEAGRRAAHEYEPVLVEDPARLAAIHDAWGAVAARRARGADLLREGFLDVRGQRRWVELRANKGLAWRAAPGAPLLAALPFEQLAGVRQGPPRTTGGAPQRLEHPLQMLEVLLARVAPHGPPVMGGGDFPPPPWGGSVEPAAPPPPPVLLRAGSEAEAAGWAAAVRNAEAAWRVESGDGRTVQVEVATPSGLETIDLPPVDDNAGEHLIEYACAVGQRVTRGTVLARISRDVGDPYEFRAPFHGTVSELFFPRLDGKTGHPYIKTGARFLRIEREPEWRATTRYLPAPGAAHREAPLAPPAAPASLERIDIRDDPRPSPAAHSLGRASALRTPSPNPNPSVGQRFPRAEPRPATGLAPAPQRAALAFMRLAEQALAPRDENEDFWTSMHRVGRASGRAWGTASRLARGNGEDGSLRATRVSTAALSWPTAGAAHPTLVASRGLGAGLPREPLAPSVHKHSIATLSSRYSASALAAAAAILDA
jgi:hypothetical protein